MSSRFIKGVMSTGLATLVTLVFGFVNIIIAVRYVPKEDFGVYVLLQVIVSSFVMISDLGLNLSVTRALAGSDRDGGAHVVNSVLCFKLITALLVTLIVLLGGGAISRLFNSALFSGIAKFIPLLFLSESLVGLFNSVLQGFHLYRRMAAAQIVLSCVGFTLTILFIVKLDYGLAGLIYARIIALAACMGLQVGPFFARLRPGINGRVFREVFNFGFPLGLNNILTCIFTRIDTILLGALLNPVQVAYYGTASKLPDACRQMFEAFRSVYFPNMSEFFTRGRKAEAERLFADSLRIVSFVALFFTLLMFLFGTQTVSLLFSRKYLESAPLLSYLMIALSIGLVGNILGTSLVAAGYSKLPVIINIVDTVASVGANIILIPMFGAMGAAYAAILARSLANPVNVWFLKKKGIQVRVGDYMKPFAIFGGCLGIWALCGPANMACNLLIPLVYLAASLGLSVISTEDLLVFLKCVRLRKQPAESRLMG